MQQTIYFKDGQLVYIKSQRQKGVVKGRTRGIPTKYLVEVITNFNRDTQERTTKLLTLDASDLDIYREKRKPNRIQKDTLLFAKTHPNAIVPTKRYEDAGFDFSSCFDEDYMLLTKNKPNLVPTGIATAMSPKYFLNLKHERGSTAKYGMSVVAGVVDSGYRGQVWVNIIPTYKDVVISKSYKFPVVDGKKKPVELDDKIMYPYDLAIAQGTVEFVPDLFVKEISYEELEKIPSVRGKGHLGSSGK